MVKRFRIIRTRIYKVISLNFLKFFKINQNTILKYCRYDTKTKTKSSIKPNFNIKKRYKKSRI
jgi:hypothetical protein